MALTQPAAQIWEMCEDYVPLAIKHLALGGPHEDKSSETTFDTAPEILRIKFLFPRIAEKGFNLLLDLRYHQWLYRGVVFADRQQRSVPSAHTAEQVEARFEELKSTVESFMPDLSAVQREIIREKFFVVDQRP